MYQKISKAISIYDLVISPFLFVLLIFSAILLMLREHEIYDARSNKDSELWAFILTVWWILLALGMIASILQGFGGYQLLCSTKKDVEPKEAIHMCHFWMGVSIFSIALKVAAFIIFLGPNPFMYIGLTYTLLRIWAFIIVRLHVTNLKRIIKDSVNEAQPTYKFNENTVDTKTSKTADEKA